MQLIRSASSDKAYCKYWTFLLMSNIKCDLYFGSLWVIKIICFLVTRSISSIIFFGKVSSSPHINASMVPFSMQKSKELSWKGSLLASQMIPYNITFGVYLVFFRIFFHLFNAHWRNVNVVYILISILPEFIVEFLLSYLNYRIQLSK